MYVYLLEVIRGPLVFLFNEFHGTPAGLALLVGASDGQAVDVVLRPWSEGPCHPRGDEDVIAAGADECKRFIFRPIQGTDKNSANPEGDLQVRRGRSPPRYLAIMLQPWEICYAVVRTQYRRRSLYSSALSLY